MEGTIISRRIERPGPRPPVLIVSAVDSSGGAGMAQDVRAADALGHPVRCAVTSVTVQDDSGVVLRSTVPFQVLVRSVQGAIQTSPPPAAVKVGALVNRTMVHAARRALAPLACRDVPIVLDPVLHASSGGELLDKEGLRALVDLLLPLCHVVTPNRGELAILAGALGERRASEGRLAEALLGSGAGSVLVTGGDVRGPMCVDRLYRTGGAPVLFEHARVRGPVPRGTGCCLSTAIACHLARGLDTRAACSRAVTWTVARIRSSSTVGAQRLLFP